MREQLITSLATLGIALAPAFLKFAEVVGTEESFVMDETVATMCISEDNAPVHKKYQGKGDIKARLDEGDVVQVTSERKHWYRIAYVSDEVAALGWITDSYMTECDGAEDNAGNEISGPWHEIAWGESPLTPSNFGAAKTIAQRKVYVDHFETLYCGCEFDEDKNIDPSDCGYEPRGTSKRGEKMEWEHVVPAALFGSHRHCWKESICTTSSGSPQKGRSCCAKADDEFRSMEADLQNLVPEVGQLNGDRSNYRYGEVEGEARHYGACDFEIDSKRKVAEPHEGIRGDVARITLYMHGTYGSEAFPLSAEELEMFWGWHLADPVDNWERERNARIAEIQGFGNSLID